MKNELFTKLQFTNLIFLKIKLKKKLFQLIVTIIESLFTILTTNNISYNSECCLAIK